MTIPVRLAADDLLELAVTYYLAVSDAMVEVWNEQRRRAKTDWDVIRERRYPSLATIDEDRVIVTAMRWKDERDDYATQCAEASDAWRAVCAERRDAEATLADVKSLLHKGRVVSVDDWWKARRYVADLEHHASRAIEIRNETAKRF